MNTQDRDMVSDRKCSNEDLGSLFRRAARLMKRGRHHKGPVHPAQGRVLSILNEKESMSRKELMERLEVRSGSLSELLGKLERHGFITRTQDDLDKRGFVVTVTDAGKALVSEHEKWRSERMDALFSSLSDEERGQFSAVLRKLADTWETALDEDEHAGEKKCHHHDHDTTHGHHHHGHHGKDGKHHHKHGPHAERHERHAHHGSLHDHHQGEGHKKHAGENHDTSARDVNQENTIPE